MSDLAESLQAALGAQYRLERELGGGGMSRVFVADEVALRRRVAIKLLPPELSGGITAERFRREIQLAARLQHPHIVPLLASGHANELVFYVMPFVEGDTLREKLARDGALPPADAVRIARDVAEALGYAHAQGIVHRDIKPENILLSSGHALVLDFGVAKALRDATGHGGGTTAGVALGTPLYMSPEQAAGGGDVDGRADLYALGVVLYEMLAGRPPFDGATPYDLIGAHLADTPPPLRRRSGETPAALEAVVSRCLAKRPDDRFGGAEELVAALERVAVSKGSAAVRRWRPLAAGVAALATLAGTALHAGGLLGPRSLVAKGKLGAREPVLLADFDNHTPNSTLGVTVTEALRLDLAQSRAVAVVAPSRVQEGLTRMRVDSRLPLGFDVSRELAQREGVKAIIAGDVAAVGGSYVVAARIVDAATGEVLAGFRETAAEEREIIAAVDRVSKQLRRRVGESVSGLGRRESLERVTTGSLEALALYSQAVRAGNAGRHEQAAALFERAVAIDTGFASAYRGLGVAHANLGTRPALMMDAFLRAFELRDRLPERERYLAEAAYYSEVEFRPDQVIAAYEAVLERDPADRTASNNLGLFHMDLGNPDAALTLYRQNVEAHPSTLTWGNLILAEFQNGDDRAADSLLAAWERVAAGDSGFLPYRLGLLLARQQYDSARALATHMLQGVGQEATWYVSTHRDLASIARIRGRLKEAGVHEEQAAGLAMTSDPAAQALRSLRLAIELAALDVKLRGNRAAGLGRLRAALARASLDQIPAPDRPYLEIADLYASAGEWRLAEATLRERSRHFAAAGRVGRAALAADAQHPFPREIQARALRAAGRPEDGVAQILRHPARGTEFWLLPELGASYDAAGNADSAAAVYERYLATRWLRRADADGWHRPRILFRLGEIYEQRGDSARAADYYSAFADLWHEADPDLQPRVAEARRRLAALTVEPGRP